MRVTLFLLCAALLLTAAEPHAAFTDPAQAGPDFLVQGEYAGTLPNGFALAAQVIALGNGKFEGVLLAGGLPGAGWDEKTRFHFKGETREGATRFIGIHGEKLMFENQNFESEIRGEVFRGRADMFRNAVDDTSFAMRKVMRQSPTQGAPPPPGAITLFNGSSVDEWVNGRIVDGNLLAPGTETKRHFRSVQIHVEFQSPFMPTAAGMARGNSGVYVKKEWEVQIVDSFGWDSENRKFERLSGTARSAGIHEMVEPRLNMNYPPLSWQTFDIDFTAARFDATGRKVAPAMISVRHNGVLVHDRFVLPLVGPGEDPKKSKDKEPGPLMLQDHKNPVRFRNVWVVERN
ncbi:MAG: DUF1080 domain-containing protein [Acidobacteria bacterium]|nr:DUF1080 domain-containing protein [Acidobacteriota bacterium]